MSEQQASLNSPIKGTAKNSEKQYPQSPLSPAQQHILQETPTTSVGLFGVGDPSLAMAVNNESDTQELQEIQKLLWGNNIRVDVFNRWSQGFEFSDVEPSALVQKQGGPCAVIAPVQAYLLKILIMDMTGLSLQDLTEEKCRSLLIQALCNILRNCKMSRFRVVTFRAHHHITTAMAKDNANVYEATEVNATITEAEQQDIDDTAGVPSPVDATAIEATNTIAVTAAQLSSGAIDITPEQFHQCLQVLYFNNITLVEQFYRENYNLLTGKFGVLLFMYAVFLTKGIDNVNSELSDTSEQLIHNTYGYGAQALINLMLTGRAVAHVWDNDQDVGGLKLLGINEQSDIGFITLMEQMRYCTVGSFFKNPRNPVWIMGSDTHLTVLFSNEKRLVSAETPSETARRVFKSYDPDGNNFIPTATLQDVLAALDLVSDPEYVSIMQKRLDPENLGIILMNAFMDEFFPLEKHSTPDTFDLMHYNGIPGSNENNKVRYYTGSAILLESDLKSVCASNPMMTCLQTKWPNIEINWHHTRLPSLN